MKLSLINEVLNEDKLFGNFVSCLEKYVIKNNYCNFCLHLPEELYYKIFEIIDKNNSDGFYVGKLFKWENINFYIDDMDKNSIRINRDIVKIR